MTELEIEPAADGDGPGGVPMVIGHGLPRDNISRERQDHRAGVCGSGLFLPCAFAKHAPSIQEMPLCAQC